jgi:microcystin degradation protein MlrC
VIRDAELLTLADGKFVSDAPINRGVAMDYGKTARLRKGNVEFIVVSVRYQTLDDRSFRMAGADLKNYRIVGLKSMNHFRGWFTSRADAIISADTPGARPANLLLYPYEQIQRPVYPLDTL